MGVDLRHGGNRDNFVVAAEALSLQPGLQLDYRIAVSTAALELASAVGHAGLVHELYRESGWASTSAMAVTEMQSPYG